MIYINSLLYVLDDPALQLKVLKSYYDHLVADYSERAATYELVTCDCWWPKMCHTITRYIRNCEPCTQIKTAQHALYGLLKPLEVPIR